MYWLILSRRFHVSWKSKHSLRRQPWRGSDQILSLGRRILANLARHTAFLFFHLRNSSLPVEQQDKCLMYDSMRKILTGLIRPSMPTRSSVITTHAHRIMHRERKSGTFGCFYRTRHPSTSVRTYFDHCQNLKKITDLSSSWQYDTQNWKKEYWCKKQTPRQWPASFRVLGGQLRYSDKASYRQWPAFSTKLFSAVVRTPWSKRPSLLSTLRNQAAKQDGSTIQLCRDCAATCSNNKWAGTLSCSP